MKIQDLQIVYICPSHNEKYKARNIHMKNLLEYIGCKKTEHYVSGVKGYPRCLSEATIHILKKYMDIPVLILEDDLEFTGIDEFDFDEKADAIYLGISVCAGHPTLNCDFGRMQYEKYSDTQVRILNMLSAHAVFYISKEYKQAVINVLEEHLDKSFFNDVCISHIQSKYTVLANKKPSFFQSSIFNPGLNVQEATKWEIP